jgi:hypothetical protein
MKEQVPIGSLLEFKTMNPLHEAGVERRDTVVINGSRESVVKDLLKFFSEDGCDYRCVRGVPRIGKTHAIVEAYGRHRDSHQQENIAYFSEENGIRYRELSIDSFARAMAEMLGPNFQRALRRSIPGLFVSTPIVTALEEYFRRKFNGSQKVVICLSASGLVDDHEQLNATLFLSSRRTSIKWIIEQRADLGKLKWPSKPMMGRTILLKGLVRDEVVSIVRQKLSDLMPSSSADDATSQRIGSVVFEFCGGHPELLQTICGWLREPLGHKERWATFVGSEREMKSLLEAVAEGSRPTLEDWLTELLASLRESTKENLEKLLKGQHGGSLSLGELEELRERGLALEDGRIADVVRHFHPSVRKTSNSQDHILPFEQHSHNNEVSNLANEIELLLMDRFKSAVSGDLALPNNLGVKYNAALKNIAEYGLPRLRATLQLLKQGSSRTDHEQMILEAIEELTANSRD